MSVPTGTASRYARAGVALAVAAAAVVGTASSSFAAGASSGAAGTAVPATGATSTVITITAAANTFKSATGTSKVAPLATASNSVLFTAAACPTNTADGSSNVTTAPPTAAKVVTDLVTHDKKTLTSATGGFLQSDVGKVVSAKTGANVEKLAANTTITSVSADGKSITLSADAAAAATALTVTVTGGLGTYPTDAVTYDGTDLKVYSSGAGFVAAATGYIAGPGIPAGTSFTGVNGTSATLAGPGISGSTIVANAQGRGAVSATTAPVTAATAVYPAAAITVVSGSKLIVKAPAFAQAGAYNVCVFDNTATNGTGTGAVISSGAYTVANVLASAKYTVATAPSGVAVSPSSGPSGTPTAVTITGNNLGSAPTATLGGVAVTLKAVSGQSNTFTATFPAHAPGATPLIVSTTGGPAPAANFTYLDGITVSPTTALGNTAGTILDITGAGFLTGSVAMNFGSASLSGGSLTGDANAHVFLVKGAYTNTTAAGQTTPTDECTNVTVVSDLELICTLDTTATGPNGAVVPDGAYQIVVVSSSTTNDGDPANAANYRQTIVTSASTFTVAPY